MLTNNNIIYSQIQQLNDVVDEMILKLNGEADTTLIKCSEYVIKVAHSLIITTKDIHIRINDPEKQYFVSIELLKHLIKYVIYTVYDKEDEEIEKTFYFMN
jgi:hypothetical protein